MANNENINNLKNLTTRRGQLKARITRLNNFYENADKEQSNFLYELKSRLSKFQPTWDEFDNVQSQIEVLDTSEIQLAERDLFENEYFRTTTIIEKFIGEAERVPLVIEQPVASASSNNFNSELQVKLPTLQLLSFSGNYQDWMAFSESFITAIHEHKSLTNVQKFQYLKSCLKNDAGQVIASLGVTTDNYNIAWELLKKRYENKRLIIKNHMDALFNLPAVTKDSATTLRKLLDSVNMHLRALETLKLPTSSWDLIVIHILTTKFDYATNKEWESLSLKGELPTMMEMTDFLTRRCQMLESLVNKPSMQNFPAGNNTAHKVHFHKVPVRTVSHITTEVIKSCQFCKQSHSIYQCPEFQKVPIEARFEETKRRKLCVNCLKPNHYSTNCYSKLRCQHCRKKHNSLLHVENSTAEGVANTTAPLASTSFTTNHCRGVQTTSQVLLSTAIVHIYNREGVIHDCRVLLDVGSQANFISESLCAKLKLKPDTTNSVIAGIAQGETKLTKSAQIKIKSRCSAFSAQITCLLIPQIAGNLPSFTFPLTKLAIPNNIKLADPSFNVSNQVDLLLGAEWFWKILCMGQIKLLKNQPLLQKTKLGWIIGGPMNYTSEQGTIACNLSLRNLDQRLTKFWEVEEYENDRVFTLDELECEKHFKNNYSRDLTGRFIVKLPFKLGQKPLGNSEDQAVKRFVALERKLNKEPHLRKEYSKFMDEYLKLSHMSLVPPEETKIESNKTYYLPHHAVVKNSSVSTKVRVVFDGSAKSSSGISLNTNLLVGPTIQQDLFAILTRFRTHNFVFMADIAKMYRQILISPEDQDFQRILWRSNPNETIKTYRLATVTYGTASAPFLAVRCLHQLAIDNKDNFPQAHLAILRDFYIDDVLTGANSLQEAILLRNQLVHVLSSGGFELCKFAANNVNLLPADNKHSDHATIVNLDRDADTKTLGILWNSKQDIFKYSLNLTGVQNKSTKRVILSVIAQIFDPLGLISPVIINAKRILQKLWSLKLGWDEVVPLEMHMQWTEFVNQLSHLNGLKIPRKVVCDQGPKFIEMHGFCDSSESAFGACIYVRTTDNSNNYCIRLLCSKSRVAPLKRLSIPRLELCGALLLARLAHKTMKTLNLAITKQYFWTDSTIVLAWLTRPNNWKTFVANRISEIQSLSKVEHWHHVSSQDNPADIISRGLSPQQLINSNLWFTGPKWLSQNDQYWPWKQTTNINDLEVPEQRKTQTCLVSTNILDFSILNKYSTYTKLQRVVAYCLRFAYNCKNTSKQTEHLTCPELNLANLKIIRLVQMQEFSREISNLQDNREISRHSKLVSLNPFLDESNILRVGGRLKNAPIAYSAKHPILLPQNHNVTKLLIMHEHIRQLHAGPQTTLATLRQKYWPIAGRSAVRHVIHKCLKCYRTKPIFIENIMGNLPKHRVEPARPFIHCGVDYAGPLLIKDGHGRSRRVIKAYIVLFICFATKAIHLELVCDLTSESFLAGLKRFMARRGKVSHMYSDNGTTFVGANRELLELKSLFHSKNFKTKVIEHLTSENITWHFIPPRSPHFGGLWEAGVKSVKQHLKRVIGGASVRYDEMYTLLTQIEACLNSRPLAPLSSNPDDLSVLTPAHLLIGDSLTTPVEPDITTVSTNRLSRWQRIQQLLQHFWKRWRTEYLGQLQARSKWQHTKNNLKLGSIVILKDEQLPPLQWHLGRVIQLHPGNDGIVRVATIKTISGVVKRAVAKLCILPISDNSSDDITN